MNVYIHFMAYVYGKTDRWRVKNYIPLLKEILIR